MSAGHSARRQRIAAAILVIVGACSLVFLRATPAQADPGCQQGGVYVLWARGSGQSFNNVEAQRFQTHVNYALNAAGVTTHDWAELGNLDGDNDAQNSLDPGEYPAVPVTQWATDSGLMAGYGSSVEVGTNELIANLNHRYGTETGPWVSNCSQETAVIGGYSQGADVIGWALERTGYGALSQAAKDHIGFVALYGDPRNAGMYSDTAGCWTPSWVRGNNGCYGDRVHGILGMRNSYLPTDFYYRAGSWCDQDDGICDYMPSLPGSHGTVYRDYSDTGGHDWIHQSAAEIATEARARKCLLNLGTCPNIAAHSDSDGDSRADLHLMTNESTGSKVFMLRSAFASLLSPAQWWDGTGLGWSGVTPLVGDVTGSERRADYVYLTNEGASGTKVWVATSNGGGFGTGSLWYNATGWSYAGIKVALGDVDNNGCEDLVVVTNEGANGSKGYVLLSTCVGFLAPQLWWNGTGFGWSGVTPLVGDFNGDFKADLIYLTNEGANGTKAWVATSTGSLANGGFGTGVLKWTGTGMSYSGIKPALGDVDGNGCVADLVLTTSESAGSKVFVLLSTCAGYVAPAQWWDGTGYTWSGITPFVGDVTGDKKADYVILRAEGSSGTSAFVAKANGTGFTSIQQWWNNTGMSYGGIKAYLR